MSTIAGYFRTSNPLSSFLPGITDLGKIRYRTAPVTLSAENEAHREQQALRPAAVNGRVARTDRGAIRVRARQSVSR